MDPVTAYTLDVSEAARLRRGADLLIREGAQRLEAAQTKERESLRRGFSIVRCVKLAAADGVRDGAEREISEELARQVGQTHDRHRPFIPWSALTGLRTLQVGTSAVGGYLVGGPATPAVDALFPFSTVIRLGAQVMGGVVGNITIPRVSANGTGYWLGELGTATASQPTLAGIACTPKQVGAYTEVSRLLLQQAPDTAERMIGNHLLGVVGAAIDAAVIAGTGTSAPTGVTKTANLGALTTGTSFDWAAGVAMVKTAATANVVDENIKALAAPATRETLSKRAIAGSTWPYIWAQGRFADVPAFVNSNVPSATLIVGDFSTVVLPMWGALQIESNPFAQFAAGVTGFRVIVSCDCAVTQPACFAVSTGIT